jgi:ubiquinone/menaquinone biosynthesis C-methylase UbiE
MSVNREKAFWNKTADRYSRRPVSDEAAYQKKLDKTREYFQPDMEVLEIGCGTGSTAIAHAPYVGHMRASDLSPRMIEIAREKAKAEGVDNVTFEASSIEGLDVPDASIDVVMAHNILHLLDNWEQAIADIHRMLKPGGVFVSRKVFSVADLKARLEGAGFEIDYEWQPKRNAAAFIVCRKP